MELAAEPFAVNSSPVTETRRPRPIRTTRIGPMSPILSLEPLTSSYL